MSKRGRKGAAPPEDARRTALMSRERRGAQQTTPPEFYQQARGGPLREPFYLWQLGLHREPFETRVPRGELPPVIRTRRFPDT